MNTRILTMLLVYALLSSSCAARQPAPGSGLPALISLDTRVTSATEQLHQNGSDAFLRSSNAATIGQKLLLPSAEGEMAWGIWRFTPPEGKDLFTAQIAIDEAITPEFWLALADFDKVQWSISGPFTSSQTINLATSGAVISPAGNIYMAVLTQNGDSALVDSLNVEVEANIQPTASFTANPQVGEPGEAVTLDASTSIDDDGTIDTYEWDLDGDGSYETDFGGPVGNTSLPYPAGTVTVGLRVTDDLGGQGTTTLDLESNGDVWQIADVAIGGTEPSLGVMNGTPAIAYYYGNAKSLRYAFSNDPNGLENWNSISVQESSGEDNGHYCSLALINGRPAISYVHNDGLGDKLQYAYSSASDGNGAWNNLTVPSDGTTQMTSLAARPDGTPGIAYYNYGGQDLDYAYSTQPDGSSDWTSQSLEIGGTQTGLFCSQELVSGDECISYCNSGALKFARHTDAGPWDKVVIDANPSGYYSSLVMLASGNPAIAYFDWGWNKLEYVWADDGGTNDDWHLVELTPGPFDGISCSMAVVQGVPMIAYRGGESAFTDLKLAIGNDANGTSFSISTVESNLGGMPDSFTSMAEINGRPAIAYVNESISTLRLAVLYRDPTP